MGYHRQQSWTHRLVTALISMETQTVPTNPALSVLHHAFRVWIVPQQPISSSQVTDGNRVCVRVCVWVGGLR